MYLKTESVYNKDDFVQNDAMTELTVTITLCEYRTLVRETTLLKLENNSLYDKIKEYEKKIDELKKILSEVKLPEYVREFGYALAHLGEKDDRGEQNEAK